MTQGVVCMRIGKGKAGMTWRSGITVDADGWGAGMTLGAGRRCLGEMAGIAKSKQNYSSS